MNLTFSQGHYNKYAVWKRLLCV